MPTTFFTSDTHFGHTNILKLGKGRPFSSIEEHDEALVKLWNETVGPEDVVYHLGDFAYRALTGHAKDIFVRLNGKEHHLIPGNHDDEDTLTLPWTSVRSYVEDRVPDRTGKKHSVVLFHYPIQEWAGFWRRGGAPIHLHGHTHGQCPGWRRRCDVAVDSWDFAPASLDRIIERLGTHPDINPQTLLPFEVIPK
jgi:calcineurin-like phosphoesterase family protein